MNDRTVITEWVLFGVFALYSFFIFIASYTVGHHYGKHDSEGRIEELEAENKKLIESQQAMLIAGSGGKVAE